MDRSPSKVLFFPGLFFLQHWKLVQNINYPNQTNYNIIQEQRILQMQYLKGLHWEETSGAESDRSKHVHHHLQRRTQPPSSTASQTPYQNATVKAIHLPLRS